MVRKSLGRGLNSLLADKKKESSPVAQPSAQPAPYLKLPLASISPNPFQPREEMEPEALAELVSSVRLHGVLEPVMVRTDPSRPQNYQLIAGERRFRAAQQAGLSEIPAQIRECNDREMLEIAIIENVQRENLNPIEEARAYRRLLEGTDQGGAGLTQQQVADRVGKKRATVANLLRLLDLPGFVQQSIQEGILSQGHGKVLAGLEGEICSAAWLAACEEQLSVRALETLVKNLTVAPPQPTSSKTRAKPEKSHKPAPNDPNLINIEEALAERLRTKVKLNHRSDHSGTIEIQYFGMEDLDRVLESLDIEL